MSDIAIEPAEVPTQGSTIFDPSPPDDVLSYDAWRDEDAECSYLAKGTSAYPTVAH